MPAAVWRLPMLSLPRFGHLPSFQSSLRLALGVAAALVGLSAFAEDVLPLWPDGVPGLKHAQAEVAEDRHETGRLDRFLSYISEPTLTVYPAPGATTAVLVVPGGGFRYVCIDKEGIEVAHWLNSLGLTAAVVKYRTIAPDAERNAKAVETLLVDPTRAMRLLRANAARWNIDPARIGVMGFSAGGVMTLRMVLDADAGNPDATDPVERAGSRPDFVAFIYGGLPPGKFTKPAGGLPPFFIAHATDDPKAPVAAALTVFKTVVEAGGSAELHAFRRGDHGFGVLPPVGTAKAWTALYADWMRDLGLLGK